MPCSWSFLLSPIDIYRENHTTPVSTHYSPVRKLDVFNHIYPRPYFDRMLAVAPEFKDIGKRMRGIPMLIDLDERFRVMDRFDDYQQILSIATPPIEVYSSGADSVDLAQLANDGMAELVAKYPDRFPGFVASLPLGDPDAAMREIERAVGDLGARGIQLFSNINGKPLDTPEYLALFDRMAAFDLPVWLHPYRGADMTRLRERDEVAVRDLVDVRLAVRNQRRDGAAGVLGHLRSSSEAEDHHPPPRRDGAVLRGPGRPGLGSARHAHVGCGLHQRAEGIEEAADRLLPDVLRRHGACSAPTTRRCAA